MEEISICIYIYIIYILYIYTYVYIFARLTHIDWDDMMIIQTGFMMKRIDHPGVGDIFNGVKAFYRWIGEREHLQEQWFVDAFNCSLKRVFGHQL